jgi:hypothetical protein
MGRLSRIEIIVSVFGLIISGLQAWIGKSQWNIAKIQLEERRPWIGPPEIAFGVQEAGQYGLITLRNSGDVPTTGIYLFGEFVRENDVEGTKAKGCAQGKLRFDGDLAGFNAFSVLAKGEFKLDKWDGVHSESAAVQSISSGLDHFAGCIVYGSPYDKRMHSTPFDGLIRFEGQRFVSALMHATNAD